MDTWYLLGWLNRIRATTEDETGYDGNVRFYLARAKEVHKKSPTDDADMVNIRLLVSTPIWELRHVPQLLCHMLTYFSFTLPAVASMSHTAEIGRTFSRRGVSPFIVTQD